MIVLALTRHSTRGGSGRASPSASDFPSRLLLLLLLLLLALAFPPVLATIPSTMCPPGFSLSPGTNRCFQYIATPQTWVAAAGLCQNYAPGSRLADIRDMNEQNFVWDMCKNNDYCYQTAALLGQSIPQSCCCTTPNSDDPALTGADNYIGQDTMCVNVQIEGEGVCSSSTTASPTVPTRSPTTRSPTVPTESPTAPTGTARPTRSTRSPTGPTPAPTRKPSTLSPTPELPTCGSMGGCSRFSYNAVPDPNPDPSQWTIPSPTGIYCRYLDTNHDYRCDWATLGLTCKKRGSQLGNDAPVLCTCGPDLTDCIQAPCKTSTPAGASTCTETGVYCQLQTSVPGIPADTCTTPAPAPYPSPGPAKLPTTVKNFTGEYCPHTDYVICANVADRRRELSDTSNSADVVGETRTTTTREMDSADGWGDVDDDAEEATTYKDDNSLALVTGTSSSQEEENDEEDRRSLAAITCPPLHSLCQVPPIANSTVIGKGTCWIGGTRSGETTSGYKTPVTWYPIVSGLTNTLAFDYWEPNANVQGIGSPAPSPSYPLYLRTVGPSLAGIATQETPKCTAMRNFNISGSWNLDYCAGRNYPYVCAVESLCPGSYKRASKFTVTAAGSITLGTCSLCEAGTYRPFNVGSDELSCLQCDSGFYGLAQSPNRTTSSCDGPCPQGYFCTSGVRNLCGAGLYGLPLNVSLGRGWISASEGCAQCRAGYYCSATEVNTVDANPTRQCAPGRCGFAGQSDAQCSAPCNPGYYCPGGNACVTAPNVTSPSNPAGLTNYAIPCGATLGTDTYCPGGNSAPQSPVPAGWYGYGGGGTDLTHGDIAACPIGSYCSLGVRHACGNGTYQDQTQQTSCKNCTAGYFCPQGSTSSAQTYCALNASDPLAATLYCPAGTPARLTAPPGTMTIPTSAPVQVREAYVPCPSGYLCVNGIATPWVVWNPSSCGSNGVGTAVVPELASSPNTSVTMRTILADNPVTATFLVNFTVLSQSWAGTSPYPCTSPSSNDGIFSIDGSTGQLTLLRYAPDPYDPSKALQYEICPPLTNVVYNVSVMATAYDTLPTGIVSSITCSLMVSVKDVNDQPIFPLTPQRRIVVEKSVASKAQAVRCYAKNPGVAETGCPDDDLALEGFPEVAATDEDQFGQTALNYSLVGPLDPCQAKFTVNSCTGLLSLAPVASPSDALSFATCGEPDLSNPFKKTLTFEVLVVDDGNGNSTNAKQDITSVTVYIMNANDPPYFLNTSNQLNLTVRETNVAGTVVTPYSLLVGDEDPGPDTLTIEIAVNDENAFAVDPVTGLITTTAAANIDYERADLKRVYNVFFSVRDREIGDPDLLSTTSLFQIRILNVNEPPVFDTTRLRFYIQENAPGPLSYACSDLEGNCVRDSFTAFDGVSTTDPDWATPGLSLTDVTQYSLADSAGGRFSIEPSTGFIYVSPGFTAGDFENGALDVGSGTGRAYTITVVATSSGQGCDVVELASSNVTVTIFLVNVNEPPIFSPSANVSIRVAESAQVGDALFSSNVSATDPDNLAPIILGKQVTPQKITFTSVAYTAEPTVDGRTLFAVTNNPALPGYALITTIVRPVFNSAPSCPTPSPISTKCYKLAIKATDNGGPIQQSATTVLILYIVDENDAPSFGAYQYFITFPETISLASYTAATPTGVTLFATDPDSADNAALTYAIVAGNGQFSFNLVDNGNGTFTLTKKPNVTVDYELNPAGYDLTVTAYDQGPSAKIGTKCLFVQGQIVGCGTGSWCNPYDLYCYEDCFGNGTAGNLNGTTVLGTRQDKFYCYPRLTPPLFRESASALVHINVANLNDPPFVNFYTAAENAAGYRPNFLVESSCLINGFVSYDAFFQGNEQFALNKIDSYDEDANPGAVVSFTAEPCDAIVTGIPCLWTIMQNASQEFYISDPSIGSVKLPGAPDSSAINPNLVANKSYVGRVRVTDGGGASSLCLLNVTVLPSGAPPNLGGDRPDLNFSENSVGVVIPSWNVPLNLTLIDPSVQPGKPKSDNLTFTMAYSPYFSLDPLTGGISVLAPLDFESASVWVLYVQVTATKTQLSDTSAVTIKVTDVNEAPFWNQISPYTITFPENTLPGATVANLASLAVAGDPDINSVNVSWQTITYSLVGCVSRTAGCPFNITNNLLVADYDPVAMPPNTLFDFENYSPWTLILRATDGGGLTPDSDLTLTLSLSNVNEPPFFRTGGSRAAFVREGGGGANPLQLFDMSSIVSDPDADDPPSSLTMVVTGSLPVSGLTLFDVAFGFLIVKPNVALDYEDTRYFMLNMSISDGEFIIPGTFEVYVNNTNDVTVSSVESAVPPYASALACAESGNPNLVRVIGTNLGLTSGGGSPVFTLSYSRAVSAFEPSPPVFSTTDCVVEVANTQLLCNLTSGGTNATMRASSGDALSFSLSVRVPGTEISGDVASCPYGTCTSLHFPPPTLSSVTVVSSSTPPYLDTRGGNTVALTGTCLGSVADALVIVSTDGASGRDSNVQIYNSLADTWTSLLAGCAVSGVNVGTGLTTITCTSNTPSGLGPNLAWRVKIARQLSNSFTALSYASPTVTAVTPTKAIPTTGTGARSNFLINGTQFGTFGTSPDRVWLTYAPTAAPAIIVEYDLKSCTVTTAYTAITCNGITPGVGVNMSLSLTFGTLHATTISPTLSSAFAYATSRVDTVKTDSIKGSPTEGGALVTLSGSGFGPACGFVNSVNCPYVSASYTGHSISPYTGAELVYVPTKCAVVSDTQMMCVTVPGTGTGHVWSVSVGDQKSNVSSNAGTTGYSRPAVGAYSNAGAHGALTQGYQVIDLFGANFGPAFGARVTASYGSVDNATEFTAIACNVTLDHEQITCLTGVGAGDQLSWTVTVDGQEGTGALTDYAPPQITNLTFVDGTPASTLSTEGGETIFVNGYNFGPSVLDSSGLPFLEHVTFGPAGLLTLFDATSTCVAISHERLQCVTPPGVGLSHLWQVQVRSQVNADKTATTSYKTPVIINVTSILNGTTAGGYSLRMRVTGWGYCDATATTKITFGSKTVEVSGYYAGGTLITDRASFCASLPPTASAPRTLEILVPDMTAVEDAVSSLSFFVSSPGSSNLPITSQTWPVPFKYDPPVIDTVYVVPGPLTGTLAVTVAGRNFCRTEACCSLYLSGTKAIPPEVPGGPAANKVTGHSHTRISALSPGAGTVQVRCPQGSTRVIGFDVVSPFLIGITSNLSDTSISQLTFDTRGIESIFVYGIYIGSDPHVTVGDWNAEVVTRDDFPCDNATIPSTIESFRAQTALLTCTRLLVNVPPGYGLNHPIVVTSGSISSLPSDPRFEYLSYSPPSISSLSSEFGNAHPTAGGDAVLTVVGVNFGNLAGKIIFGSLTDPFLISCDSDSPGFFWGHTQVGCLVPPGSGDNLAVTVRTVDGRYSNAKGPGLSYAGHFISNFQVMDLNPATLTLIPATKVYTAGTQFLKINGGNFGRPYFAADGLPKEGPPPSVQIGLTACPVVNSTHTYVICAVPQGEGVGYALQVTFNSRSVTASSSFSYSGPVIFSFDPSTARTDGKDANGNRIIFNIIGENFGIDELSLEFLTINGPVIVAKRSVRLRQNDFINGTNHTNIFIYLPTFFGKDLLITAIVAGQRSSASGPRFSYLPPDVSHVTANVSVAQTKSPTVPTALPAGRRALFKETEDGARLRLQGAVTITKIEVRGRQYTIEEAERREEERARRRELLTVNNLTNTNEVVDETNMRINGFAWSSQGWSQCRAVYYNGTVSLRAVHRVALNVSADGTYERIYEFYQLADDSNSTLAVNATTIDGNEYLPSVSTACDGGPSSPTFLGSYTVTGKLEDVGFPDGSISTCAKYYRDTITTVVPPITSTSTDLGVLPPALASSGKFGMYVISELSTLYLSPPTYDTLLEVDNATITGTGLNLYGVEPDAVLTTFLNTTEMAKVPTSGCYAWESFNDYTNRLNQIFVATGATAAPRQCLQPAVVSVYGSNFGSDLFAPPGSLRVFLWDEEHNIIYEGSTTTAAGNHDLKCTTDMGCSHDDTLIKFQAPLGAGLGLRIVLVVGNQNITTPPLIDYLPPDPSELAPGSAFLGDDFLPALDAKLFSLRGDNLGYSTSLISVFLNGKLCQKPNWITGQREIYGRASVNCLARRDVAGIRSVFVCVSGQGKMAALNPTLARDLVALQMDYPDYYLTEMVSSVNDSTTTTTVNSSGLATNSPTISQLVAIPYSLVVATCPAHYYGRGHELCVPCQSFEDITPPGAVCSGGLALPQPLAGFALIEIPVDSDRARTACPPERWDPSYARDFPEMRIYPTCHQIVACVPSESCVNDALTADQGGACAPAYRYQFNRCRAIKEQALAVNASYVQTCRIYQDPLSGFYKGVDADCRSSKTPAGTTCDALTPGDCQSCRVVFDGTFPASPRGVCECDLPDRCALCTVGTHYRIHNECVKCPDYPGLIFALFIFAAFAFIGLAYYLQKKRINLSFLAIGVDYFQVLAILATTSVPWPDFILSIFSAFMFFLGSIDIAAPECLIPTLDFTVKFYLTELMPLLALAILVAVHLGYTSYKLYTQGKRTKTLSHVSRLVGLYVMIMYILYLSCTKRALDIFDCNPLDPDDGYSYLSFTSLACDGGGLCRCGDTLQVSLTPPALIFLMMYTFGFPASVAYVVFKHRDEMLEDQYLRAHLVGYERETNPRAYDVRKRYSMMYMNYKPEFSYWMLVILLRKFGIAFASLMFRGNATFQLAVMLVILFASFTLQVRYRPYMSKGELLVVRNQLKDRAKRALEDENFVVFRTLNHRVQECVRMQLQMSRKSHAQRNRIGDMFWDDAKERAKDNDDRTRADKYFFDMNAVEAILVGALIVMCLSGIMVESHHFQVRQEYAWQGDMVIIIILVTLFGSLIYLVMVVVNEFFPRTFTRFCGRSLMKYQTEVDRHKDEELEQDLVLDANPLFYQQNATIGDRSAILERELMEMNQRLQVAKAQNQQLNMLKSQLEGGGRSGLDGDGGS